jgi:hypothetical protein
MTKIERYILGDYRVQCIKCKRWMRRKPTDKTPIQRASPPNADLCVGYP